MKVVFPKPDSPATFQYVSLWSLLKISMVLYHYSKSSTTLSDDFVSRGQVSQCYESGPPR